MHDPNLMIFLPESLILKNMEDLFYTTFQYECSLYQFAVPTNTVSATH